MTIHQDSRRKAPQARPGTRRFYGFPLWVSLLIMCVAFGVATIVTLSTAQLGLPFLGIFAVFSIAVTVMTQPRALFLQVASIPILFMLFAVLTSYLVVTGSAPDGTPVSKTQILTSLYPFLQHFPVLALTTLAAAAVAYVRIKLLRRSDRISAATATQRRRAATEAQLRNTSAARKARSQSQRARRSHASSQPGAQVTVEELMRRRQERAASAQRTARDSAPQPGAGRFSAPQQSAQPDPRVAKPRKTFNDDLYK